jgi:hypothetical protein
MFVGGNIQCFSWLDAISSECIRHVRHRKLRMSDGSQSHVVVEKFQRLRTEVEPEVSSQSGSTRAALSMSLSMSSSHGMGCCRYSESAQEQVMHCPKARVRLARLIRSNDAEANRRGHFSLIPHRTCSDHVGSRTSRGSVLPQFENFPLSKASYGRSG